jgi:hypothetical protein
MISRNKSYTGAVYLENFSIDRHQSYVQRTVMGFFTVCGNVGGIQHVFFVVSAFFFMQYSNLGFKLEAFKDLFRIKSKEIILDKNGSIKISFC